MSHLLTLACAIALPVLAWRGLGYRGAYAGLTVVALVIGTFTCSLGGPITPDMDDNLRRGTEFFNRYGGDIGAVFVGMSLGGLLGALMFRPRDARAPDVRPSLTTCPWCAEEIQSAAVLCKHCGRDIPARRVSAAASRAADRGNPPTPAS